MKKILILFIAFILICTISAQEKIVTIKVLPDQVTLHPGQTYRFIAQGFNARYEEVQFQPNWSVEGKGRITRDGVYTAGNNVDEMDFVKAVYPRTQAQGAARVLIRLKKEEKPYPPAVKPTPRPVPAPHKPAPAKPAPTPMPSEVVKPMMPVHPQPVPGPIVTPKPKPVPTKPVPVAKPHVPHHPMPEKKMIQVVGWDIKSDGLLYNRIRIRGKVSTEVGNLLQLVVEGMITDTVLAEVRIHMEDEAFSFEAKYFKTTAKALKLVIYDIEENKIAEVRQAL